MAVMSGDGQEFAGRSSGREGPRATELAASPVAVVPTTPTWRKQRALAVDGLGGTARRIPGLF